MKTDAIAIEGNEMWQLAIKVAETVGAEYVAHIARSDRELYGVLARVQAVYGAFAQIGQEDLVRARLAEHIKTKQGARPQKNTSLRNLVVRYTLGVGRQVAFVYSRALEAASNAGKSPAEVAAFIEQAGGISALTGHGLQSQTKRAAQKQASEVDAITRLKTALKSKEQKPLATLSPDQLPLGYAREGTDFVVLLAVREYLTLNELLAGRRPNLHIVACAYPEAGLEDHLIKNLYVALAASAGDKAMGQRDLNPNTLDCWRTSNGLTNTKAAVAFYEGLRTATPSSAAAHPNDLVIAGAALLQSPQTEEPAHQVQGA